MFWLHCNACLSSSSDHIHLSNCGHSFCTKCFQQSGNCCVICRAKPIRFVQLGPRLKPDIQKMFRDPGLDIMGAFKALEFQRAQNVNLVKLLKKKIGLLEKEGKHFQETVKMYQSENERLREKIHLLQSQQLQLPYHIQPSPMVLDRHNNSSMSILGGKKSSLSGQGVNPVSSGHLFLKDSVTSPRVTRRGIRNMISSPPQIPNMLVNHCPPNLEQNGQTLASEANNPTFGGMKINAFETPQAFKRSGKQPSMSLLQKMSGWISK